MTGFRHMTSSNPRLRLALSNVKCNTLTRAFSDVHPTLDPQNHPLTEYIQYRLKVDGQVSVRSSAVLSEANVAIPRGDFACTMGQGIRFLKAG
jgi:hypothetical protein